MENFINLSSQCYSVICILYIDDCQQTTDQETLLITDIRVFLSKAPIKPLTVVIKRNLGFNPDYKHTQIMNTQNIRRTLIFANFLQQNF